MLLTIRLFALSCIGRTPTCFFIRVAGGGRPSHSQLSIILSVNGTCEICFFVTHFQHHSYQDDKVLDGGDVAKDVHCLPPRKVILVYQIVDHTTKPQDNARRAVGAAIRDLCSFGTKDIGQTCHRGLRLVHTVFSFGVCTSLTLPYNGRPIVLTRRRRRYLIVFHSLPLQIL